MAKLDSAFPFRGSLGDVSGYKRNDSPQHFLRYKGGPNDDQIKNSPSCARVRENNSEFKGVAASVKQIRLSILSVLEVADSLVTSRFTKSCKAFQLGDNTNPRGQRSILFSKFGNWMSDFELNKNVALNSVIKISEFTIHKSSSSARIVIPALVPGVNFSNPWKQPKYRIMASLSALPDMIFSEMGYVPANQTINFDRTRTSYATDFLGSNLVFDGVTIDLQLNDIVLDDSTNLILAVGVQFANEQPSGTVPVKRAACGKILSIG